MEKDLKGSENMVSIHPRRRELEQMSFAGITYRAGAQTVDELGCWI